MDSVREQIEEALQRSKIHKETVYGILRQIADAIEPPAPAPVKALLQLQLQLQHQLQPQLQLQLQHHQLQLQNHQLQHQKHQRKKLSNVSLKRRLRNRRSKFIFYKYKPTY